MLPVCRIKKERNIERLLRMSNENGSSPTNCARNIGAIRVIDVVHLKADALIRPPRRSVVVLDIQHASGNTPLAQPLQACQCDLHSKALSLKRRVDCNDVYLAKLRVTQRSTCRVNLCPADCSELRRVKYSRERYK